MYFKNKIKLNSAELKGKNSSTFKNLSLYGWVSLTGVRYQCLCTSDAVSPCKKCESQYSITQTKDDPQQVQHTHNLRGHCVDPQSTYYESQ